MNQKILEFETLLLIALCMEAARSGMPRTVYHDRIDGLLLPPIELFTTGSGFGRHRRNDE